MAVLSLVAIATAWWGEKLRRERALQRIEQLAGSVQRLIWHSAFRTSDGTKCYVFLFDSWVRCSHGPNPHVVIITDLRYKPLVYKSFDESLVSHKFTVSEEGAPMLALTKSRWRGPMLPQKFTSRYLLGEDNLTQIGEDKWRTIEEEFQEFQEVWDALSREKITSDSSD